MADEVFRKKLLEGETVIWSGQPAQGLMLFSRDAVLVPFSLMWGGFAVFWESRVVGIVDSPVFMKLWGVPFLLVGVYLVIGRFLIDAFIRKRTHYAVTNRRILIIREAPFGSFTALRIDRLSDIKITERSRGLGTICFGPAGAVAARNGFAVWTPSLDATPKFLAIKDVQAVFQEINRAQVLA